MDADRFDDLLRSLSATPSRRRVLHWLSGAALGGALGWLGVSGTAARKGKRKKKGKKGKGKGNQKVRVCHNGQTIEVGEPAVNAHLRHGDTLGDCPPPPPVFCATQPDGIACHGSAATTRRCCNGACPPQPTCKPAGAACPNSVACAQECCSESGEQVVDFRCDRNRPEDVPNVCATDGDCVTGIDDTRVHCVCNTCCYVTGTDVEAQAACETCCNGCAPGGTICA